MEPTINVGILHTQTIQLVLNGYYCFENKNYIGLHTVEIEKEQIRFGNKCYNEILFTPENPISASFDLQDVLIGIGFHWERKETQRFRGSLKLLVEDEKLTAINIISVEDYLTSVISSEMSATSSMELLKTHAVTSRSWLLAQLEEKKNHFNTETQHLSITPSELTKWYDKDDHTNFDVCADDHCQRYQGITRASTEAVKQAIEATRGQVLMYKDKVCDTRFSKCCGGIAELFENCWEPQHHDYLLSVEDKPHGGVRSKVMNETEVERFIKQPEGNDFCSTTDAKVLSQVLNSYDQETPDFYRWKVEYTQTELKQILTKKSGIDFGEIIDLIPIERGFSGRLIQLQIIGSKHTLIVGKELEIRKWLSESHLYSSAFIVEKSDTKNTIPQKFTLYGAGWGHGVGLCQIGAAVMAEKGYLYQEILKHYFRNTSLKKIYE